MIIKKYIAATETEAETMAKQELGENAIVMNVKTIKKGGLLRMFSKPRIELTAAIDDNVAAKDTQVVSRNESEYRFGEAFTKSANPYGEAADAKAADAVIEEKINTLARLLDRKDEERAKNHNADAKPVVIAGKDTKASIDTNNRVDIGENKEAEEGVTEKTENRVISLIKQQLLENEVSEKNADIIISELEVSDNTHALDVILSSAYQKIVLKLGQIEELRVSENKPKIVFFVGNTGVGKTTTMAKLASKCKLNDKAKVAMFSVDTYRIAAIEQIKTYANILSTPMEVVYTPEDMQRYVEKYSDYDLILVDTAGRSHTNENQRNDLMSIFDSVQEYEKEIYLVVSATTKYSDLMNIANTYSKLFDYRIIFTKLDETRGIGNILNLKLDTGKQLSYVTWGQNVPDDIGEVNPQVIAKKLLGGAD